MKKLTAVIAASALIASSSLAFAGGPIQIIDEGQPTVVVANDSSSSAGSLGGGGVGVAVAALVVIGAALALSDSGSH